METPPTPASSLFSLDTPEGLTFVASLSRLSPHLVSCHSQSLTASPRHSLGLALISSSSRSRAPRSLRRRQKQTEPVKQHLLHRWVVVVVVFLFHRSLGTSQLVSTHPLFAANHHSTNPISASQEIHSPSPLTGALPLLTASPSHSQSHRRCSSRRGA